MSRPIVATEKPDVTVTSYGGVLLLNPESEAGREWLAANLSIEPWQLLGDSRAIDSRYIEEITCGIRDAGLTIETE
jgi:hypothetical protein